MKRMSIASYSRFCRRLWMVLVLIIAVMSGMLQPATPAHADQGYAYYWSLTFDFADSANGTLFVAVGYDDDGAPQDPPLYTQTSTVSCRRTGNATVSGGVLKLNGGYLSCDLDVQGALKAAFVACSALVRGCHMDIQATEPYASVRAMAKVLAANPGTAPIFYHPNAAYVINPQSATTQITAALSPHGVIPSAPVLATPALNVWQNYTARYACDPSCEMYYGVTGSSQVVLTADADVPFYTAPTTVYIGYDPATNTAAPVGTQIDSFFIDPPNHGNGG